MKSRNVTPFVLAACLLAAAGALAEDPVALIVEGATATGLPAGHTVNSIAGPAANHSGGWAFNINTSDGVTTYGAIWGNGLGGAGNLMRIEGTYPPYTQTSYESFWGLGGGGVVSYSPLCNNLDTGATGLDAVWLDDAPVATEQKDYPHQPGWWWSFGSRPGVTEDGVPYFVGGITDALGGATDLRGLFYGHDAAPVIMGGQLLPGLPLPLSATASPSFDYRYSAYGSHFICLVDMEGSTATDAVMVMDGAGLLIAGQLVQEGMPVPAAAGGLPGENWAAFDYCGVTESGRYMFTGDTSAAIAVDEFVLVDGQIVLREGAVLSGNTVSGAIESAYMNDDGDWAVIWDVTTPTGANVEALIFNGQIVLMEGDFIDRDGDGIPNVDATVTDFTGIAALAIGDRTDANAVTVYFTADVNIAGAAATEPVTTVLPADDRAGRDGPVEVQETLDVVVEIGYGLTFGGAVPAMLGQFTCEPRLGGVHLAWLIRGDIDDGDLTLRADADDRTWTVPILSLGAGRYEALDTVAAGSEIVYSLLLRGDDGSDRLIGEQQVSLELPARGVALQGAYPNPFNPETKVSFRVGAPQRVELAVYDASGRLIAVLADQVFGAGQHVVAWNGLDRQGSPVPSGTYVARITSDQAVQTTKLMLVK